MEIWIAAGDETGGWDIVDGGFDTEFIGLAWVLGPMSVWELALQMPIGSSTALAAFSQPIKSRLPTGLQLPFNSSKYHLMDIWGYCKRKKLCGDVELDKEQEDPVLELLRQDAAWLLKTSGLGVLTTGGNAADAKAAGLGLSGDGLRERARAFAGLMTVALPFFPADSRLNLLVEGRTELDIADAVKANRFSDASAGRTDRIRYSEPYRDFVGRLREDLVRSSERSLEAVTEGSLISDFFCVGKKELSRYISQSARDVPFIKSRAEEAVSAMNGIADLAAALIPREDNSICRIVVPSNLSKNYWTGNFRELRHALQQ